MVARTPRPVRRLFYAAAGPADLIGTHRYRVAGGDHPGEVSRTFSGQIEQFAERHSLPTLMISTRGDGGALNDGLFSIRHRGRPSRAGAQFHLDQLRYGLYLLREAQRFKADAAILDLGVTHVFAMTAFRRAGIAIVPVLHNTLWPTGFPPTGRVARIVQSLDRRFWRAGPSGVIGVSPETLRQVRILAPEAAYPMTEAHAQFDRSYFERISPPPPHAAGPFTMLFVGRADRSKGLLDLPAMASWLREQHQRPFRWIICGDGPDLPHLREAVQSKGLQDVFDIRGWTTPEDLRDAYGQAHAAIVPTRSSFAEGMAMTAIQAVCAGRPLVTNPVVPALEVLRDACLSARPDDPLSHAQAVLQLARDKTLYDRLRAAAPTVTASFFDPAWSLDQVLERTFAQAGLLID